MIGIDMEKISRFAHWEKAQFERVFTKGEMEYADEYENKIEHYCGFFCVKEAFVKALDDPSLVYNQIEILHEDSGKPYIKRTRYIESLLKKYHLSEINISISHTGEYAVAVVSLN